MQANRKNELEQSEHVRYNTPDFPVYVRAGRLSMYPNFSAISHWHDDVEFLLVQSGRMEYNINGSIVMLHEGEGIFVNTRQLHYGFSSRLEECAFCCILLHPLLLCASPYVEQKYVVPVMENKAMPYVVLHPDRTYEADILRLLGDIARSCCSGCFALTAQSRFFAIWENLFRLSGGMAHPAAPVNQHLSILKDMIRFIYNNYTQQISLSQICGAGNIGKTTCCAIFQKYTNETPVSYLTNYRLKKAIELLETTDLTVSEICFATGFSDASYFSQRFRRAYGCTPTEYRAHADTYTKSPA